MNKTFNYEAPAVAVVEIEIEGTILNSSNQDWTQGGDI